VGGCFLLLFYDHVQALVELLDEEKLRIPAWVSFNSKDGVNVVSGDSLTDCVALVDKCIRVVAVGINCTPPRFILDLIRAARKVTIRNLLSFSFLQLYLNLSSHGTYLREYLVNF
jgi:S-methylmethionine-dependent homocysteine/selenocysteine methylase